MNAVISQQHLSSAFAPKDTEVANRDRPANELMYASPTQSRYDGHCTPMQPPTLHDSGDDNFSIHRMHKWCVCVCTYHKYSLSWTGCADGMFYREQMSLRTGGRCHTSGIYLIMSCVLTDRLCMELMLNWQGSRNSYVLTRIMY